MRKASRAPSDAQDWPAHSKCDKLDGFLPCSALDCHIGLHALEPLVKLLQGVQVDGDLLSDPDRSCKHTLK